MQFFVEILKMVKRILRWIHIFLEQRIGDILRRKCNR